MTRGIAAVCDRLDREYGDLGWWPAAIRFEILVGAVLVQNTAWTNVTAAIDQLRAAAVLDAGSLLALSPEALAALIRPAGYFNVKAKRLHHLCAWFQAGGGFAALDAMSTGALRQALLEVHGVGPETCDDILLYAFDRPVFVIDAYTRRIFERLGLIRPGQAYETLRADFEHALGSDAGWLKNCHAVIVEHGKSICRARPRCSHCVLSATCAAFQHGDN